MISFLFKCNVVRQGPRSPRCPTLSECLWQPAPPQILVPQQVFAAGPLCYLPSTLTTAQQIHNERKGLRMRSFSKTNGKSLCGSLMRRERLLPRMPCCASGVLACFAGLPELQRAGIRALETKMLQQVFKESGVDLNRGDSVSD